jgi:transcriptional regulator with XRE-family HTH domain
MSTFTLRLKQARARKDLSQRELGALAGIPETTAGSRINQYENGVHLPNLETMQELAKALDIPVTYFYAKKKVEAKLVRKFHHLTEENKTLVINYVTMLLKKQAEHSDS